MLRRTDHLTITITLYVTTVLTICTLAKRFAGTILLNTLVNFIVTVKGFLSLDVAISGTVGHTTGNNDPRGTRLRVRASDIIHPIVLIVVCVLLFHTRLYSPLTTVLPLLFTRIYVGLVSFFHPSPRTTRGAGSNSSAP